jgi:hypothetical protein
MRKGQGGYAMRKATPPAGANETAGERAQTAGDVTATGAAGGSSGRRPGGLFKRGPGHPQQLSGDLDFGLRRKAGVWRIMRAHPCARLFRENDTLTIASMLPGVARNYHKCAAI